MSELDQCRNYQEARYARHKADEARYKADEKQGVIRNQSPFASADEVYLLEVLTECRAKLESALKTAQGYSRLPDLAKGLGDAIAGIHEAAAVVLEPETYLE